MVSGFWLLMLHYYPMSPLSLRRATSSDSRMLWEWANDPAVRAASFSTDLIPWENHRQWFDKKLEDIKCHIFVAEEDSAPAGQVRFDCEESDAVVDVHLAPGQRGKGLGRELITSGIKKLFEETDIQDIHAYVKIDNEASRKTFEHAGFKNIGTETMKEHEVYHYILKRP